MKKAQRYRTYGIRAGAIVLALLAVGAPATAERDSAEPDPLSWPEIAAECRPWTYNWWPGSAVDRENLARELRRYADAGLGGIHIVPIYGAKGAEARYVEYLSPAWLELLDAAVSEARRLGLGVDMTTGTGWCFGGPNIPKELGGWRFEVRALGDPPGKKAIEAVPDGPAVKRAAPGGAGPMLNPFDPEAMRTYLERFTQAFASYRGGLPRAMYHDSFEYRSQWMPKLLEEFARRRGYRLEAELDAFAGDPRADDRAARVRADYKETLSDLMIEEVFPQWIRWCRERGMRTRNQAHGSPGNILDLYALADIPETEMFGRGERDPLRSGFDQRFGEGDRSPLVSKFASSAAHVAGRRLVSAETGTWLAEHFAETLEELKCLADLLFAAGANHLFYHGTCYSPDDAPWPGWLFYASTQMNPRNPIWRDAPALNAYIARAQAVLQAGSPDSDILLYWPIHDFWHEDPRFVAGASVHDRSWLEAQPIGRTAKRLWDRGYAFDYISDRLLLAASAGEGGSIRVPGGTYRAVVVPPCARMPLGTLEKLLDLAEGGGPVIFEGRLPSDVPGLADLEARRAKLRELLAGIALEPGPERALRKARVGTGLVVARDLEKALETAGIPREPIVDGSGVLLIRRRHAAGRHYLIANQSASVLSGFRALATPARSAAILDPLSGRTGVARLRRGEGGQAEVFLRLEPGHSLILRTYVVSEGAGGGW
ncbi:MAG: glycosyl hydrolase, partial [Planctomycetota bacterium]